jgi:predicted transcriptional regulator
MVSAELEFSPEEYNQLQQLAEKRQTSVSALVRHAVDRMLHQTTLRDRSIRRERAIAALGRFHSGLRDVSARHDDYLAEDFAITGDK